MLVGSNVICVSPPAQLNVPLALVNVPLTLQSKVKAVCALAVFIASLNVTTIFVVTGISVPDGLLLSTVGAVPSTIVNPALEYGESRELPKVSVAPVDTSIVQVSSLAKSESGSKVS